MTSQCNEYLVSITLIWLYKGFNEVSIMNMCKDNKLNQILLPGHFLYICFSKPFFMVEISGLILRQTKKTQQAVTFVVVVKF